MIILIARQLIESASVATQPNGAVPVFENTVYLFQLRRLRVVQFISQVFIVETLVRFGKGGQVYNKHPLRGTYPQAFLPVYQECINSLELIIGLVEQHSGESIFPLVIEVYPARGAEPYPMINHIFAGTVDEVTFQFGNILAGITFESTVIGDIQIQFVDTHAPGICPQTIVRVYQNPHQGVVADGSDVIG